MALQNPETRKRSASVVQQLSMVMELPFVLIVAVLVGGGAGYLMDRWLHASPALMLVGGVLGFGIGIWNIVQRLSRSENKRGSGSDDV